MGSDALDHLPPLRQVIAAHDLRAKKSLGQNFLLDPAITDRIAAAAGDLSDHTVIEIGPGPGGLTRSLLRAGAKKLIAIEFDPRAVVALHDVQQASSGRLHIIQDDALALDWANFFTEHQKAIIVANLPYNIATTLLVNWLKVLAHDAGAMTRMVLMFQAEVGNRLCASPHSRDYGRISVLTQWLCAVDHVFTLPPGAFTPPPKVHSSVLRFIPHTGAGKRARWATLDALLQQAFAQRRKMLRGNLKNLLPQLQQLGIDPTLRAEDISVQDYLKLAQLIDT